MRVPQLDVERVVAIRHVAESCASEAETSRAMPCSCRARRTFSRSISQPWTHVLPAVSVPSSCAPAWHKSSFLQQRLPRMRHDVLRSVLPKSALCAGSRCSSRAFLALGQQAVQISDHAYQLSKCQHHSKCWSYFVFPWLSCHHSGVSFPV